MAGGWQTAPCICCWFAAVAGQRAQQSGLQPSWIKHSAVAGRATAIAADFRSLHSLHSVALGTVGELTCFETACADNENRASLLLSRLMNDHAKTCSIVVDISTNSIKNTSFNSLEIISYNYQLLRKNSLPNFKWTRFCTLLQSIRIYKVYNSSLNDWFWYFAHCTLEFRFMH